MSVPLSLAIAGAGAVSLVVFGWSVLGVLAIVAGLGSALVLRLVHGNRRTALPGAPASDPFKELRQSLFRAQYLPGVGALGEQAVAQLDAMEGRFRDFQKILSEKLQSTELTYGRYLGAAEGVRSAMFLRLCEIASELSGLGSEDPAPLQERMKLAKGEESEALQARLSARDSRMAKARGLLTDNERALTEFDHATAAVGSMSTAPGLSQSDFESALRELEEIARRASKFQ